MFGTQIHWITFIILLVQVIILPFLYINYLYNTKNIYGKRFLKLTLSIILYNFFSGLFPDPNINLSLIIQNLIAYAVGIIYVLYFVYYLYNEFHIIPFKYFSVRSIFIYLIILFIFLFSLPLFLGKGVGFSRRSFIIIPLILAIVFTVKTSLKLIYLYKKQSKSSQQKHFKLRIISANIGVFSLLTLPIILFFGDYQFIEQPIVNFGYFIMLNAFIKNQIYIQQNNYKLLGDLQKFKLNSLNENIFESYDLTTKEKEIASFIVEGYKYKEIANLIFITEKTVSKHASNIFKKVSVKNRSDFEKKIKN